MDVLALFKLWVTGVILRRTGGPLEDLPLAVVDHQ
jgi:hypothetical protein